jgi:hypothetical protein
MNYLKILYVVVLYVDTFKLNNKNQDNGINKMVN